MSLMVFPKRVVGGLNCIKELGKIAKSLESKNSLVVMDPFLAAPPSSLSLEVNQTMSSSGVSCVIFSDFHGEPTTGPVNHAVQLCREMKIDCVIAVGGGSAIDIAKAVATFAVNEDLEWCKIPSISTIRRLPLIAVPTTAGTGSEVTKVMVVKDEATGVKMNPGHPDLVPDVSVLDPNLTVSMPQSITVFTGLDALTHAIEAYVSRYAQPLTDTFALVAIEKISGNLRIVYANPSSLEARAELQEASMLAGLAFSNASTNLAHAMGRPLGARFHLPHGLSVAIMLPFVIRFGLDSLPERYQKIARALGDGEATDPTACLEKIEDMWNEFDIWSIARNLIDPSEFASEIEQLTTDALSGNGIQSNFRVPTEVDVRTLYMEVVNHLRK